MKRFVKGQRVKALTEEIQLNRQILISLDGSLLRITNSSSRSFVKGDSLDLIVISENPLEFKLYSEYLRGADRFA